MPVGWNHPDTVRYYEAFCAAHSRYHDANQALIGAAELQPGQAVLDLASGTGRTAQAALPLVANVTCVEPAAAMRVAGRQRLPQARWLQRWPQSAGRFDRVLCGAAIWQLTPLQRTFARVARQLRQGGAFTFNMPSLYLGEADQPGGGADPHLLRLPVCLAQGRLSQAAAAAPLPNAAQIESLLQVAGFSPARWSARSRLSQDALRDWLKIPVLTDALLGDMTPDQRASQVDAAYAQCDPDSWRWEAWSGWTAWKR